MQVTMGTSAAETLSTAGNIFVGQTEAPLMIKPYLHMLTLSELHAVMASGFATIAGTVFKIYVDFGACAEHLLAASVMSAPAVLAVSKLLYPETEDSLTKRIDQLKLGKGNERNALEAIASGATSGIYLVLNICANLIAFVALLAFCNSVVGYLADLVDVRDVDGGPLTLEIIVGYAMYPLAFLLGTGTDHEQLLLVGRLIGVKTLVNEFVAFEQMGKLAKDGLLDRRAVLIATYALCGFSNVTAIGIQLGGLGAMCPEKRPQLAAVAVRALCAGAIACFMTACVAGLLTETVGVCDVSRGNTTCIELATV